MLILNGQSRFLVMPLFFCWLLSLQSVPQLRAACQNEGVLESCDQWVFEARNLIGELEELARATPESPKDGAKDPVSGLALLAEHGELWRANSEKVDELNWKLWLLTGLPPQAGDENESLQACLERNATEYRDYVSRHMHSTEAELNRMALSNAVKAIGSPLWHTTLKFLEAKIGREMQRDFVLCVCPSGRVVRYPLRRESYVRMSQALEKWVAANEKTMEWDLRARQFRPRSGEYVGTHELAEVVAVEFKVHMENRSRDTESGNEAPGAVPKVNNAQTPKPATVSECDSGRRQEAHGAKPPTNAAEPPGRK